MYDKIRRIAKSYSGYPKNKYVSKHGIREIFEIYYFYIMIIEESIIKIKINLQLQDQKSFVNFVFNSNISNSNSKEK